MINIEINDTGVTVTGHANYAPSGYDVVCASVSVLLQNLVFALDQLTETEIEYSLQPGNASLTWAALDRGSALLVDSFVIGVSAVAEDWSGYVAFANNMSKR